MLQTFSFYVLNAIIWWRRRDWASDGKTPIGRPGASKPVIKYIMFRKRLDSHWHGPLFCLHLLYEFNFDHEYDQFNFVIGCGDFTLCTKLLSVNHFLFDRAVKPYSSSAIWIHCRKTILFHHTIVFTNVTLT